MRSLTNISKEEEISKITSSMTSSLRIPRSQGKASRMIALVSNLSRSSNRSLLKRSKNRIFTRTSLLSGVRRMTWRSSTKIQPARMPYYLARSCTFILLSKKAFPRSKQTSKQPGLTDLQTTSDNLSVIHEFAMPNDMKCEKISIASSFRKVTE